MANNTETVRVVRLPDGTLHVGVDATPGPKASWIYSRFVAEMIAEQTGGTVEIVEVVS